MFNSLNLSLKTLQRIDIVGAALFAVLAILALVMGNTIFFGSFALGCGAFVLSWHVQTFRVEPSATVFVGMLALISGLLFLTAVTLWVLA